MKKTWLLFLPVLPVILILSCSKSDPGNNPGPGNGINCDGPAKTFAVDVNPLIQTFCNQANCHASGSTNGPGPLTNYTQVFGARAVVRNAVASGLMPQNSTLTAAQKAAIVCWIDSGAPNN
jgi:hypothetical protein